MYGHFNFALTLFVWFIKVIGIEIIGK